MYALFQCAAPLLLSVTWVLAQVSTLTHHSTSTKWVSIGGCDPELTDCYRPQIVTFHKTFLTTVCLTTDTNAFEVQTHMSSNDHHQSQTLSHGTIVPVSSISHGPQSQTTSFLNDSSPSFDTFSRMMRSKSTTQEVTHNLGFTTSTILHNSKSKPTSFLEISGSTSNSLVNSQTLGLASTSLLQNLKTKSSLESQRSLKTSPGSENSLPISISTFHSLGQHHLSSSSLLASTLELISQVMMSTRSVSRLTENRGPTSTLTATSITILGVSKSGSVSSTALESSARGPGPASRDATITQPAEITPPDQTTLSSRETTGSGTNRWQFSENSDSFLTLVSRPPSHTAVSGDFERTSPLSTGPLATATTGEFGQNPLSSVSFSTKHLGVSFLSSATTSDARFEPVSAATQFGLSLLPSLPLDTEMTSFSLQTLSRFSSTGSINFMPPSITTLRALSTIFAGPQVGSLPSLSIPAPTSTFSTLSDEIPSFIWASQIYTDENDHVTTFSVSIPVVTTMPSDYSERTVTNTNWTENTMVTTTNDKGQTTIFPVIINKSNPSQHGVGVILINPPKAQNRWSCPKVFGIRICMIWPHLPKLKLPPLPNITGLRGCWFCINLSFDLPPIISVDFPPTIIDPSSEPPPVANSPPEECKGAAKRQEGDNCEKSSSGPSSTSTSSSSTSSSSSSSASATPTAEYLLWPRRNGTTHEQHTRVTIELQNLFGSDMILREIPVTAFEPAFTVLWVAPLNSTHLEYFRNHPYVMDITPRNSTVNVRLNGAVNRTPAASSLNQTSLNLKTARQKREAGIDHDFNAWDSLRVISQRPGQAIGQMLSYDYEESSGLGTTIYIIDSGASMEHIVLKDMVSNIQKAGGTISWLFPGKGFSFKSGLMDVIWDDVPNDPEYSQHGTCVLAKALAPDFGTARKSNLVIVKLPEFRDSKELTPEDQDKAAAEYTELYILSHEQVLEDIRNKFPDPQKRRVVINFSQGIDQGPLERNQPGFLSTWKDLIKDTIDSNIVYITSAGNNGPYKDKDGTMKNLDKAAYDSYPPLFADESTPIIIVGATNDLGVPATWSQIGTNPLNQITVWGPADDTSCPFLLENGDSGIHEGREGTSFSTPMAAGLCSDFMSNPRYQAAVEWHAKNLQLHQWCKDVLIANAYPREQSPPNVLVMYNGIDLDELLLDTCASGEGSGSARSKNRIRQVACSVSLSAAAVSASAASVASVSSVSASQASAASVSSESVASESRASESRAAASRTQTPVVTTTTPPQIWTTKTCYTDAWVEWFDGKAADDAVSDFCVQDLTIGQEKSDASDFLQNGPKKYVHGLLEDHKIIKQTLYMQMWNWNPNANVEGTECYVQNEKFAVSEADCRSYFNTLLDCHGHYNWDGKGYGGWIIVNDPSYGCLEVQMYTESINDLLNG